MPILQRVYSNKCTVKESEWAKGQKETRIIDTLEPVMSAHRLVVNESTLRADVKTDDRAYQLTHITRDRGCLAHDDRLDALAGGVAHYMRSVRLDMDHARAAQVEAEREELMDAFEAAIDNDEGLFVGRRLRLDDVPFDDWGQVITL